MRQQFPEPLALLDPQLQAIANFKADHIDAYDSECDDEATANAIFMADLSPVGSLNDDTVAPHYDSDTLSEGNSDVISFTDYMLTIRDDADNYVPLPVQKDDMMLSVIPKVVEKNNLSKSVTLHLTTNKIIEKCTNALILGLLKIETKPINEYFKNNRAVHRDYLRITKEHVATLQELLEQARSFKPLDEHIGYASKFASRIQELTITKEHRVKQNTRKTDNTILPSIGRVNFTNASGSKLRGNTQNYRIPQPSSRDMKNKVEARYRKFKSSANKNNHVLDANV
uniref:Uncharacterized protein n=1 Tax=Tanacetum cinerariifolium TaxID=118510 RepID=A0A6L2LN41_TANCI|nr:hypothetical protein [Tanacetum cinerariifolium]